MYVSKSVYKSSDGLNGQNDGQTPGKEETLFLKTDEECPYDDEYGRNDPLLGTTDPGCTYGPTVPQLRNKGPIDRVRPRLSQITTFGLKTSNQVFQLC